MTTHAEKLKIGSTSINSKGSGFTTSKKVKLRVLKQFVVLPLKYLKPGRLRLNNYRGITDITYIF